MGKFIFRYRRLGRSIFIFAGVTTLYYGCADLYYGREGLPVEAPSTISFNAYRLLPLNLVSRVWGHMSSIHLREPLRNPIIGLYARLFHCNLEEAAEPNVRNYSSLSEFFRRALKPNARHIDEESELVCPCDGRILYFGKVENGQLEQIKGVSYSLAGFLGPLEAKFENSLSNETSSQTNLMNGSNTSLHHCIIYLAPGDYHRFHSPADWKISYRRYFPGYLLSVNPRLALWIRGLFSINERVIYFGKWKHGFFAYAAVGATNVGSINIFDDKTLSTNAPTCPIDGQYQEEHFEDIIRETKGKPFGEFNLGSSIILIFEAPNTFQFDLSPGDKVLMGQNLQKL